MTSPPVGGVITPREGRELITNFHYPTLRFPKTEFVEYPKWINMPGYESEMAYDADGEALLLSRPAREAAPAKKRQIISSHPIQLRTVQVQEAAAPVVPPVIIPLAWWRRSLLWLAHKLEALANA